jgi:hypothetical protein
METRVHETIATSRRLLARSRRLIRASRVLLRPLRGGQGWAASVPPERLRQRIRELFDSRRLPPLNDRRSWIAQGRGDPCAVCEEPIGPHQWEHEVDLLHAGEIRAHRPCFRLWLEESTAELRKTA